MHPLPSVNEGHQYRANDFRDAVQRSSLPAETKRLLHGLNRRQAWFRREAVAIDGTRRFPRTSAAWPALSCAM